MQCFTNGLSIPGLKVSCVKTLLSSQPWHPPPGHMPLVVHKQYQTNHHAWTLTFAFSYLKEAQRLHDTSNAGVCRALAVGQSFGATFRHSLSVNM